MMKKILMLSSLCFINATYADELSDAISASRLDKVQSLVAASQFNNEQLREYLEKAEKTLIMRKDYLARKKMTIEKASYEQEELEKQWERQTGEILFATFMLISFGLMLNNGTCILAGNGILLANTASYLSYYFSERYKNIKRLHSNAVEIKKLFSAMNS